jgi:hypothetical protein
MSLPTHSMPISPSSPSLLSSSFSPSSSGPFGSVMGSDENTEHKHAIDFATHSWDLATGGMKTLTAKRELPTRPDRRARGAAVHEQALARNYTFALIILICLVLMLIGGGVVLFVMLQP